MNIKNILLYAGVSREKYIKVESELVENNRRNLTVFTALVVVAMVTMYFVSFGVESLVKNRGIYATASGVCAVLCFVTAIPAVKRPWMTLMAMYIFAGILFAFGIALGTFIDPNEVTTSYLVLIFAVPMLFNDKPIRIIIAIFISILAYFAAAVYTQDPVILGYNATNVIPYGILGMIVSSYMMTIKVQRYSLALENKFLSESDQLTNLLNRRSYEQHIQALRESCKEGLIICAFDVNGLKKVNDNLGHRAGDELIKGAADCINAVFGQYGVCYRIGGDEFVAVLDGAAPTIDELKEMLWARAESWNGVLVSGMSISMGAVRYETGMSVDDMINAADKKMYANKANYYLQAGNDRRHR